MNKKSYKNYFKFISRNQEIMLSNSNNNSHKQISSIADIILFQYLFSFFDRVENENWLYFSTQNFQV